MSSKAAPARIPPAPEGAPATVRVSKLLPRMYESGGPFEQLYGQIRRQAPGFEALFSHRMIDLVAAQRDSGTSGTVAIEALGARVEVWVEVVG